MASHPLKKHSAEMTDGPSRAPARAMLKAIGFNDEDLAKPIIGVRPWGQQRTPAQVAEAAATMVGWNTDSIVAAVRAHAL